MDAKQFNINGTSILLKDEAARNRLTAVEGKIPSDASPENKLITKTVDDLLNYYLKSETYTKAEVEALIGAIQHFHYEVYASTSAVTNPASNVLYLIGPTGSGADKYEEYVYSNNTWVKIGDTSIDLSGYVTTEALNTALAAYTTTANLTTLLAGKQDVIADLVTIRANATSAYQKPSGGIPKTDLDSGVKASLELADSAIQPAEFNELEEEVGTIGNGAYEEAWDGSSAPVVADIPAGVSVTYSSTSYTGTLAASASTVDKIYLVSDGNGNYDRYVTVESGGTYSWKKVGTTAIPLSNYATKSEVSQLGQELHKDSLVAMTPQKLYGRYCNNQNKVVATSAGGGKAFNAAYFSARSEAWAANVVANNITSSVTTGTIALVDSLDEIAVDATVSPVVNGHPAGTYSMDETVVVPAGKILVVFEINYSTNIFYYNEFVEGNIAQLETNDKSCIVSAINEVRSSNYEDVLEAITPTKIYGRRLTPITGSVSGLIAETSAGGGAAFNIAYFPARSAEWNAKILAEKIESSISIGAMAFVDSVDSLAVGEWINPFIPAHPSNQGGTPWNADYDIKVPAGKILVVFEINYSYSVYHYNEIIGARPKTADIDARLQALENPDYVQENPLAVTKETPGYTAIFRKMGVIGGSMSSGAHSHRGTTGDGNLYEFSTLQFMARMCGSEGFNFSEGGMSARAWVNHPSRGGASSLFLNNACDFYLIQLGNNDFGIHRDTDPSYLLGTTADLTPTGGVYPDTFFGNMGAILQKIRDVQPRAYVFLSTFLRGYGNIPADFDYNQAIRDIVTYFSDPANRPSGDELHYYLIDYYTYGAPYSYYYSGVHEGTVRGDHPVATGYLFWAWQYCTYIDWIIKNNMEEFNDVAFVGTDMYDNP